MKRNIAWRVSWALGLGLWVLTLYRYNAAFEPTDLQARDTTAAILTEDSGEVYEPPAAQSAGVTAKVDPDTASRQAPVSTPAGCINVNTADEAELCLLPGVGEVLAQRIIAYRQQHGSFKSAAQLCNVKGIGKARLEKINERICF